MTPEALDWVARFCVHLGAERRMSPHTRSGYLRELKALVGWCEDVRSLGHRVGVRGDLTVRQA